MYIYIYIYICIRICETYGMCKTACEKYLKNLKTQLEYSVPFCF